MQKCMNFSLLRATFHTKIVFFWEKFKANYKKNLKVTIVSNSSSLSVFFTLAWNTKSPACFDWPLPDNISWVSCQQLKFKEDFNLFPQILADSSSVTVDNINSWLVTQACNFADKFSFAILLCGFCRLQPSLFHAQLRVLYKLSYHAWSPETPFSLGCACYCNVALYAAIHETTSKGYDHSSSHLDLTSSLQFPNTPNANIVSPFKNFYGVFLWQILSCVSAKINRLWPACGARPTARLEMVSLAFCYCFHWGLPLIQVHR